jgi:hypothetical protein
LLVLLLAALVLLAAPAAAATVPSAPRSVTATAGPGSVRVTWQKPLSNGGAPIDRYLVVRTAPGLPTRSHTVASSARALTIDNLTPGTRYTFRVQAHNRRGWSPASAARSARPLARAGFGTITTGDGVPCGAVGPLLGDAGPSLVTGRHLDFGTDPYDDPADRPQLTAGGQAIVAAPSAGGSSLFSEVFAFEVLSRCENARLLKTEDEVLYDDPSGERADLLVSIAGSRVGVTVVRAFTFPPGSPPVPSTIARVLDARLDDVTASTQNVAAADAWVKQVLVVVAYDQPHADAVATAWAGLDAATRSDTVVEVVVTDGDDTNLY